MRSILLALALLTIPTITHAASRADCESLWKTLDVDANGALESSEDKYKYVAAIEQGGTKLAKPGTASRDEFLAYCEKSIADTKSPSPANTKDFGKGDLTPAKTALSEADAKKKLEANGFKNIQGLKLDDKNIWRGTADAGGKTRNVGVDAQGDIVAAEGTGQEQAPTMQTPAPVERGQSGKYGFLLWIYLFLANAGAFIFMTAAGGETSAMSNSGLTRAERGLV